MPKTRVQGALVTFQVYGSGQYPIRLVFKKRKPKYSRCGKCACRGSVMQIRMCRDANMAAQAAGLPSCSHGTHGYYVLKFCQRR